jgi:23S rRNA (cytosine1962-C5)-methyltransferase
MTRALPVVLLGARGVARMRGLHPWVFRDDIEHDGDAANGDTVRVADRAGRTCGHAFYSARSKIALRRISAGEREPDATLWTAKLDRAGDLRRRAVDPQDTAFRAIHAESDGFPGLVVDRYAEHLVVQRQTAAAERLLAELGSQLIERTGAASILARDDSAARGLEGLDSRVEQVLGRTPESIEVREGPIVYAVDPWRGQKTGAFLDQRSNRVRLGALCRGRVLDAFCYQGGFALHAAGRADEVLAIDSSEAALARGREAAERNGVSSRIRFVQSKVFDELKRLGQRGERFDVVFVDPPAFARSRADVRAAARAYGEVNRRALGLVAPEGLLVTCSCSYNFGEDEFERMLVLASREAGREARVLERFTQSPDHPVLLGFPESHYLKGFVLNVL